MAENKQPFDDFNADEFDSFDDEDFNFDDDEEASFQFDEETESQSENPDENSEYEFSSDEVYTEAEEPVTPSRRDPMAIINSVIERIKNEEPKQLIKYGIGAAVALLLIIGGLVKLIMPGPTPTKTTHSAATTTRTSTLSQGNSGISSVQQTTLSTTTPVSQSSSPISTSQPVMNPNEVQPISNLTPTSAVPTPVPEPAQTSMPVQQAPTAVQTSEQPVSNENTDQLQHVESQNSDLTKRISDLETTVGQLNTQLAADAQMNASNQAQISGLIKSIDSMQTQMAKLNNAMQTIVSAVAQSSNNGQSGFVNSNITNNNMISNSPDYYVQAVIPGRAWLKNASGQIITVAPGDAVPGYGTVTSIDSQNGIVVTSTGTKIVFGIDEG